MSRTRRAVYELATSEVALRDAYDVAMLDLDGVVYVGPKAVAGAPDALAAARAGGMRLAFITNNAARPPERVAEHLTELGIDAAATDVVTSAQAAARLVAGQVPEGADVLVVGGEGLIEALKEYGLGTVGSLAERPAAVVQGFHPTVGWELLAEGAYAVATGIPWIASNTDRTIPTARGVAPGNGILVAAVAEATGREPLVAGKPEPALFDETLIRIGGQRPLVVGDRLDTDIEGANAVSADSLAVLTGVSTLADLAAAEPTQRPVFAAPDLRALGYGQPEVGTDGEWQTCGSTAVRIADRSVEKAAVIVHTEGGPTYRTAIEIMRATLALAWRTPERLDVGEAERRVSQLPQH